jgi:hypothetical protein
VSSGGRVIYRLSLRGNRRMNHAIHMAAVTQIGHRHSKGRAYYGKKTAEGKTSKEALRALKRQVSDAIYRQMKADARRAAAGAAGPGGHPGNGSVASVAGLHPAGRLFGQATPGPDLTLRLAAVRSKATRSGSSRRTRARRWCASAASRPPRPVPAGPACRAPPGQALACPLFLPPGAVEAPGTAGGRRPSRASAMRSTLEAGGTAP